MDAILHMLWVILAVEAARRLTYVSGVTAHATMLMAVAPDLLRTLPSLGWIAFGTGSFSMLTTYSMMLSEAEPALPQALVVFGQLVHSLTHSAVVALAVTVASAVWLGRLWFPLLGWWLHIVIDVFSHSPDYSSPAVLFPIATLRLDGVAWNEDWFIATNVATLLVASAALYLTRDSREPSDDGD